jgi:hypothetical protein
MVGKLIPVAKSIILCEDVLPGPGSTGNVHLMNVFSAIRPTANPPYPYRLRQLCVFLQLTDALGEGPGRIVGRQAETDRIVFSSHEQTIRFQDRLQQKWVHYRLTNCPFPTPGLYWIQFSYDDQLVGEQTLKLLG